MLFNSYAYLCAFLPITLVVFEVCSARGWWRVTRLWLIAASLFFYSWWNPVNLPLLICSILANYQFGRFLSGRAEASRPLRLPLAAGVIANLGLLGYFKYAGFLVNNFAAVTGSAYSIDAIVLPLAISFFTFQQIAYLVDASRAVSREANFLDYSLFVSFFPQLIAGPIVHHLEMMPQFAKRASRDKRLEDWSIGLSILCLGLLKKVVLADNVAVYATPVFAAADLGATPTFFEAWFGALAYSAQLYFDFSGYSDMAIGSARLFGIKLPLNFESPYKSPNLIDFWRRWHMTLSRFLRDYLYFSLGGNRRGPIRRYLNLFLTMALGGLWHGAGWNFLIWGAMHGSGLMVNHAWHAIRPSRSKSSVPHPAGRVAGIALTYAFVVIAWVVFRAETFEGALRMYTGMIGANGVVVPGQFASLVQAVPGLDALVSVVHSRGLGSFSSNWGFVWVIGLTIAALALPNTQQMLSRFEPALGVEAIRTRIAWQPNLAWGIAFGVLAPFLLLAVAGLHEFLYFQF